MAPSLIFELCFGVIVAGMLRREKCRSLVPGATRFGRSGAHSDERMTP